MAHATDTAAMADRTSISVSEELADELYERKRRGDSYEDVIRRLIERADAAEEAEEEGQ
jgi:predicted CopG family antitoxin